MIDLVPGIGFFEMQGAAAWSRRSAVRRALSSSPHSKRGFASTSKRRKRIVDRTRRRASKRKENSRRHERVKRDALLKSPPFFPFYFHIFPCDVLWQSFSLRLNYITALSRIAFTTRYVVTLFSRSLRERHFSSSASCCFNFLNLLLIRKKKNFARLTNEETYSYL